MRVSSIGAHFGEERVLVGGYGSGTIFFAGCNLHCAFCQNWSISQLAEGEEVTDEALCGFMLELQGKGCHNINIVTPTHYTAHLASAMALATERGLEIPLVYNCGGYENVEVLKMLDGIVDIYMPDIKYGSNEAAARYSSVPDYWDAVRRAVREMHRQVGDLHIGPDGLARRGLLVRHLVLPHGIAASRAVIDFLADEISVNTYINVMDQYRPAWQAARYPELMRRIEPREWESVAEYAVSKGLRLAE
ncbi:MAG: radical SAM protein [Bacteroidota bacterium]|nr:radical SAM protein [Bacteroidota bacterium]